jgi:hypothetical protein
MTTPPIHAVQRKLELLRGKSVDVFEVPVGVPDPNSQMDWILNITEPVASANLSNGG